MTAPLSTRRVHVANVRLRAVAWHRSHEPDGKGGVYDSSDVSRYEVSVCRKRVGAIVSSEWGYWRGELLDGAEVRGDYGYNGWSRAVWGLLQAATTRGDAFPEGFDVPPKGAAALLRAAAWGGQHGHVATPRSLYVSAWCGGDATRSVVRTLEGRGLDFRAANEAAPAAVKELCELKHRYDRAHDFATRGWQHLRGHSYADNSDEVEEVNPRLPRLRRRMTRGPGGDACF